MTFPPCASREMSSLSLDNIWIQMCSICQRDMKVDQCGICWGSGKHSRRNDFTIGCRRNLRGVRSGRSSSSLSSSWNIFERTAGGVFWGSGIGCGCSPQMVTKIYGQASRYSSQGSKIRNFVLHESTHISGRSSCPFSSRWLEAGIRDVWEPKERFMS